MGVPRHSTGSTGSGNRQQVARQGVQPARRLTRFQAVSTRPLQARAHPQPLARARERHVQPAQFLVERAFPVRSGLASAAAIAR